ncbi:hypothetical protein KDA_68030 [Dictyobacter alpinus]|uniref:Uncharacterized protein n=1 Tax=Dictyobacter alpinus TaxID=2014873 RepID=A0A402BJ04_9CHLR|nr:hypothetical protein KDA_68030 [Dictyobacter alpinus]
MLQIQENTWRAVISVRKSQVFVDLMLTQTPAPYITSDARRYSVPTPMFVHEVTGTSG